MVEVWNKIDLLDPEALDAIRNTRTEEDAALLVSAQTGVGNGALLELIEDRIAGSDNVLDITLPVEKMGNLNWIYENTHIIDRNDNDDGSLSMRVRVSPALREQLLGKVG